MTNNFKSIFKNKLNTLVFSLFIITYGTLLIYLTYKINISEDETYTLNTTTGNLARVIKQSYHFEGQPPGYFILLYFWRLFSSHVFFAKLFSIILTGFSAYILYRLMLLFSIVKGAKWILVIFLLNPFTVWAALEIRTYSLLILLSLISLYCFYRFLFENKKKFLFLFLVIVTIGLYTQYFFIFLIATLGLILLIYKGWKEFWKFCLYLLPVGLLFLPNLIFIGDQITLHETKVSNHFSFHQMLPIIQTSQSFLLGINLVPDAWTNRIIRLIFITLFLYTLFKLYNNKITRDKEILKKIFILFAAIVLLTFQFIVAVGITKITYEFKYMSLGYPFFILLFIVFSIYSKAIRNIMYGTLSLYYVMLLFFNYKHPVKTYDYISLSNYIQKIESPGEPILIYRPAIALPFDHYYKGKNMVFPLPHPVNFDSSYLINIRDTNEFKQAIENINLPATSYLMISDTTLSEGKLNMNRQVITDYINSNYEVSLDTLFYGWSKNKPLRIRSFKKFN